MVTIVMEVAGLCIYLSIPSVPHNYGIRVPLIEHNTSFYPIGQKEASAIRRSVP